MPDACRIESGDSALIRIVDAALAEAVRLSGARLACRPGCTGCCMGPFPITQLDARRLREGLAELEACDPTRAGDVRERARQSAKIESADAARGPALSGARPGHRPVRSLCARARSLAGSSARPCA